jgi:hypothetical protein
MIRLDVFADLDAAASLDAVRAVAATYPGDHTLELVTASGRRLRLGPEWRFDASPGCLGTLAQVGVPIVLDDVASSTTQPNDPDASVRRKERPLVALETQDPPVTDDPSDELEARRLAQAERERTADFDPASGTVAGNGDGDKAVSEGADVDDDGQGALFVMEKGVKLGLGQLIARNTKIEYEFKLGGKGIKGAAGMGLLSFTDPERTLVVPGRAGKIEVEPTYDGDGSIAKVVIRAHFKPLMAYDASTEAGRVALGLPPRPLED